MTDKEQVPENPEKMKPLRKPEWIRMSLLTSGHFNSVRKGIRNAGLHTVCQEAHCPNVHECWGKYKTATYMVLGDTCTRCCRFCAVFSGIPGDVDRDEPERLAESVREMGVRHAVVTMVTRDDLADGGAGILAATVRAIHALESPVTAEILSSDLAGNPGSIRVLVESRPEIIGHNLETVRRLSPRIRSGADYDRSLEFLSSVRKLDPKMITKSGLMLGLGEEYREICSAMDDLRSCDVDILTLGQYLQPGRDQVPVEKYLHPDEFARLREEAIERGFLYCESGPMVRSSYRSDVQLEAVRAVRRKNAAGKEALNVRNGEND